jgi:hypothetical protein
MCVFDAAAVALVHFEGKSLLLHPIAARTILNLRVRSTYYL